MIYCCLPPCTYITVAGSVQLSEWRSTYRLTKVLASVPGEPACMGGGRAPRPHSTAGPVVPQACASS